MTLIEFPDLEQGSDDWLDQRRGIVTASMAGRLVTAKTIKPASNDTSRSLTSVLTSERITGWVEPNYVSSEMLRGHEDEPRAVDVYSEHYAPVVTTGFMVRDDWGFKVGYSPDGLVGDDGLIEVKSRRPRVHLETILADEMDTEFMAQIQCGLLVSGRAWCDFISYCGGMPMYVKRVEPIEAWQIAILAAVELFETNAAEMIANYEAAIVGLPMTERIVFEMEMTL